MNIVINDSPSILLQHRLINVGSSINIIMAQREGFRFDILISMYYLGHLEFICLK